MNVPSMTDLLEAGVHFGHQVKRWNPKMQPFIYTARDGVHVLDLAKTVAKLEEACVDVEKLAQSGGMILFLGTKRQAKDIVWEEAKRCGAFFVIERWIGGLITNFDNVAKNIGKLNSLKGKRANGDFDDLTKKEQLLIDRQIAKLERLYGGVSKMEKLPDAIYIVDCKREQNAVLEAAKRGVKIVAICDTNVDPTLVDFPIPGNDDAIKAIKIITGAVADAYLQGRQVFEKKSKIGSKEEDKREKKEKSKEKRKKNTTKPSAKKGTKKTVKKSLKK